MNRHEWEQPIHCKREQPELSVFPSTLTWHHSHGTATTRSSVTWAYPSDQSVAFSVDAVLQGDLLLRCRHLTAKGTRVSMFRAGFHTG